MKRITPVLFFIDTFLNLWANYTQNVTMIYITKPLLMLLLIAIYYSSSKKPFNLFYVFALLFSMIGDVFLMIKTKDLFIFGLASFLIAHVLYIFTFKKEFKFSFIKTVPFLSYFILIFSYLYPHLPTKLLNYVLLYAIVITCMGISVVSRKANKKSYYLVLFGAVLFILSDTFIAINKFVNPLPYGKFLVSITYIFGQYLILKGFLCKDKSNN